MFMNFHLKWMGIHSLLRLVVTGRLLYFTHIAALRRMRSNGRHILGHAQNI